MCFSSCLEMKITDKIRFLRENHLARAPLRVTGGDFLVWSIFYP